ncbi:MAG: ABC transporter ATP-binding protein [Armatimonadota bacterium]
MSKPIIEIQNISKKYRLGVEKEKYLSLRDEIMKFVSSATRKKRFELSQFWALKDISFDVQNGEAIGIIGKNGAGKSTMLKVLSKITPPTTGQIIKRGRVASLLEVGTGFHPELTGRENIYLNGAILGMTRKEIARKFDDIVDFSEISKFLDTPVKRYSSGMYVRLAFAVAAHLEPEILVVDEVLAVGDVEFQKKCLGKMNDVAKGGRTVLFVSHNLSAVSQLCTRGIVLEKGQIKFDGKVDEALTHYTQGGAKQGGERVFLESNTQSPSDKKAVIKRVYLTGRNGLITDTFFIGESQTINIEVEFKEEIDEFQLSFIISTSLGSAIYHCVSRDVDGTLFKNGKGIMTIIATFDKLKLYPGKYIIDEIWLASKNSTLDCINNCIDFIVPDSGPHLYRSLGSNKAIIHEVPNWSISKID